MTRKTITNAMLFAATALIAACSSGGSNIDDTKPDNTGKAFVKNTFIMEFTTTDCKFCPYMQNDIKTIQSQNPGKVFTVAVHGKLVEEDPYRFPRYQSLETEFGVGGSYPFAIADQDKNFRFMGGSQGVITTEKIKTLLSATGVAGLKLNSTVNGSTATLELKAKVNVEGSYKVAVAIIENGMVYPQSMPGTPSVQNDYVHNHVLRAYLTDLFGDNVGTMTQNQEISKTYTYTIPAGYVKENLEFLAYLIKTEGTKSSAVNSQLVKFGSSVDYQY